MPSSIRRCATASSPPSSRPRRQPGCARAAATLPLPQRLTAPKALLLDVLSGQFRRRAARAGLRFNPGFAGAYDFTRASDFGALMKGFLDRLPDDGLIMCHPGFVDDILVELDPLTVQREHEHAYLAGEQFPAPACREQGEAGLTMARRNAAGVLSHTEI